MVAQWRARWPEGWEENPPSAVAPDSQVACREVVQPVVWLMALRSREACPAGANRRMEATSRLPPAVGMPVTVVVRPLGPMAALQTMNWQRRAEQAVAGQPVLVKVTRRRAHPLRVVGPVVG